MKFLSKHIVFIFSILSLNVLAQQTPVITQNYGNEFFFNPAAANLENSLEANLGFRKDWMNIDDSPRTIFFNVTIDPKDIKSKNYNQPFTGQSGFYSRKQRRINHRPQARNTFGLRIFSDRYGLFASTTFNLNYTVHIPINRDFALAAGIGAGVKQFNFDANSAILYDNVDPTFNEFLLLSEQKFSLDMNAGLMLYGKNIRFGYSMNEITDQVFGAGDIDTPTIVSRDAHTLQHVFLGSYELSVTDEITLIPNFMAMAQRTVPFLINTGVRATYRNQLWLSTTYRSTKAFGIALGTSYQGWLNIGYAYDFTFGRSGGIGNGSHEIILGLRMY